MALTPGSSLGAYEVVAKLGEGGMGEVYRARDTRLGREVALEILPAVRDDDDERRARFTREAQVLAALNNPRIAAIHDIVDVDGYKRTGKKLDMGGSCVHFKKLDDLPLDVVGNTIARVAVDEYVERYGNSRTKKKTKTKKAKR